MKTQSTKLLFKKDSIVDLNEKQLQSVIGGTSLNSAEVAIFLSFLAQEVYDEIVEQYY